MEFRTTKWNKAQEREEDDPKCTVSPSPFKTWTQTHSVQPLPHCNLSLGTSGEVLQHGFFFIFFWTSGSVAKKSPTSENHYPLLNGDSLSVAEIAPLLACFSASSCHHLSCPHPRYFLNPADRKSISKRETRAHFCQFREQNHLNSSWREMNPDTSPREVGRWFSQISKIPGGQIWYLISPPVSIHWFVGTFWG